MGHRKQTCSIEMCSFQLTFFPAPKQPQIHKQHKILSFHQTVFYYDPKAIKVVMYINSVQDIFSALRNQNSSRQLEGECPVSVYNHLSSGSYRSNVIILLQLSPDLFTQIAENPTKSTILNSKVCESLDADDQISLGKEPLFHQCPINTDASNPLGIKLTEQRYVCENQSSTHVDSYAFT